MRTIITTAGTSLLSNARETMVPDSPIEPQLAKYLLCTTAQSASAETNSLSHLISVGDRVILLHSSTNEGRSCALALQKHLEKKGTPTTVREIPDLSYQESKFKMRGLRGLVSVLAELIHEQRKIGNEVWINATGGFKAEAAYATLVGLLFDVPVFYIHEIFQEVISMPSTPIGWDYSFLVDHEEFFEWIKQDMRSSAEVNQRLQSLPAQLRILLAEEEGFTFLSPAGEAFYEAFLERLEEAQSIPILLSSAAMKYYNRLENSTRPAFDRLLSRLRLSVLRKGGSGQVGRCDCLIFPRGDRDQRIFYVEDRDGTIRVLELSRHSDKSYDRALSRGVKPEQFKDFVPWKT